MGQLRRHFGEDASSILRGVRCAFISHIHGDHHIGLSKLLSQRKKVFWKYYQFTCLITLRAAKSALRFTHLSRRKSGHFLVHSRVQ